MGPFDVAPGQLLDHVAAARPHLISGSARGHEASPFRTSISMLISSLRNSRMSRHTLDAERRYQDSRLFCQIAVFKGDGTFYKGSR